MIGVAFLNEIIFWGLGITIGWFLGRKYQKAISWMKSKGYMTNVFGGTK